MNKHFHKTYLVFGFFCVLFFAGCAARLKTEPFKCGGKGGLSQSLSAIRSSVGDSQPVKANGVCRVFSTGETKESFDESFAVKFWHNPPGRLSLFGEVLFDPQAIFFGVNGPEFWVCSKHMSLYYWGNSGAGRKFTGNNFWNIRPDVILETAELDSLIADSDKIVNDGIFDILISEDKDGVVKKVFIEPCSYLVEKVEYSDFTGSVFLSASFGDYQNVSDCKEYKFPHKISIQNHNGVESVGMEIEFSKVSSWQPSEAQLDLLFTRPEPAGFENVFKVANDGRLISQ